MRLTRIPGFTLVLATLVLGSAVTAQEDAPAGAKAPDPQVAKDVAEFMRLVNDKQMSKDLEARTYLSKWAPPTCSPHPIHRCACRRSACSHCRRRLASGSRCRC